MNSGNLALSCISEIDLRGTEGRRAVASAGALPVRLRLRLRGCDRGYA